ncbi:MAG: ribosomal protein S18-alanine N-acetyltransferase [Epulopiscium sp.]|nr:ribosomal protein S18-alanine N-acetyltransferase [Candidatus Epulonipiscium sp.]
MIDILPLTEEYLEETYQLEKLSFSEPWSRMTFIKELENPHSHYYILLKDEKLIGYAGMLAVLDEGHIMNIAVDRAFRGQGVGKQLVNTLLDKARQLGLIGLTLEVRSSNRPAISLYESLGFVNVGIRKDYYHYPLEDGIIMWNYFADS